MDVIYLAQSLAQKVQSLWLVSVCESPADSGYCLPLCLGEVWTQLRLAEDHHGSSPFWLALIEYVLCTDSCPSVFLCPFVWLWFPAST